MGAVANNNFNPLQWNYTNPSTWNEIFQGAALIPGIFTGSKATAKFYRKLLSAWHKILFGGTTAVVGGPIFIINGNRVNWDPYNQQLYAGMLDALTLFLKNSSLQFNL